MALQKHKKLVKKATKEFVPFEKENVIHPIKLFISIVPFGQADNIVKMLEEVGVTTNVITAGEGTGRSFMPGLISVSDSKKQIIMSFIREDKAADVCKVLEERFNTSKASKGLAFSIKLTSVAGVSIYKFLTNTRKVKKVKQND